MLPQASGDESVHLLELHVILLLVFVPGSALVALSMLSLGFEIIGAYHNPSQYRTLRLALSGLDVSSIAPLSLYSFCCLFTLGWLMLLGRRDLLSAH